MEDNKILLEGEEQEEEKNDSIPSPDDTSSQENAPIEENAPVAVEEPPLVEENGVTETSIKTFTQPEVDKLIGDTRVKTREKTFSYIYNRYGVNSEEELDNLVANAQRYDTQKEMYDDDRKAWETERNDNNARLTEMSEQIALMQSGVDKDRFEDVKLILKGKGLEVTVENIEKELETHPEWKPVKEPEKAEESVPASNIEGEVPMTKTRITTLGNEPKPAPQETEEEQAEKLFKLKFH